MSTLILVIIAMIILLALCFSIYCDTAEKNTNYNDHYTIDNSETYNEFDEFRRS